MPQRQSADRSPPPAPNAVDPPIDLDAYDYALPRDAIAQQPLAERDAARLLVVDRDAREAGGMRDAHVRDLPVLLRPGDLLVVNATEVLPARLVGHRESGGAAEALLLGKASGPAESAAGERHRAWVRISGRLRPGIGLRFEAESEEPDGPTVSIEAEIVEVREGGEVVLSFAPGASPYAVGRPPLPPYISRDPNVDPRARGDRSRYQTVFARVPGAVAAPTAGLHLTERLLEALEAAGVGRAEVVLHVGPGTFRPLRDTDLNAGRLHAERYELCEETAAAVAQTRRAGGRVVAVGTTTARVLESRAAPGGVVKPGRGETDLFLRPGCELRVVDALLTNFHLPRSSLLLLVAAFAGRDRIFAAYEEALARGYRFYSYGDAMLIL